MSRLLTAEEILDRAAAPFDGIWHDDRIECPHCGCRLQGAARIPPCRVEWVMRCAECRRPFVVRENVTVEYGTWTPAEWRERRRENARFAAVPRPGKGEGE